MYLIIMDRNQQDYIENVLKNKQLSTYTKQLYNARLRILNDCKKISNLNFLYNIEHILNKLSKYKLNTKRTYIITILSVLKEIAHDNEKIKTLYDKYFEELEIIRKYIKKIKI